MYLCIFNGVEILDLILVKFKINLLFIVDNCFATPYLQNPIQRDATKMG